MTPKVKSIDGVLEPWFETGTEGVVWSVYKDRRPEAPLEQWSYKKLYTLSDGDLLTIYAPDNKTVVFHDFINLIWPKGDQPSALGFWVNGVQMGLDPEEWAKFFFPRHWMDKEDAKPLWATLYQAPKPTWRRR